MDQIDEFTAKLKSVSGYNDGNFPCSLLNFHFFLLMQEDVIWSDGMNDYLVECYAEVCAMSDEKTEKRKAIILKELFDIN